VVGTLPVTPGKPSGGRTTVITGEMLPKHHKTIRKRGLLYIVPEEVGELKNGGKWIYLSSLGVKVGIKIQ